MIDYEEELEKFLPALEVEEAEATISQHDCTDLTDIMRQMINEVKRNNQ